MTIDELARKIDQLSTKVDALSTKVDQAFAKADAALEQVRSVKSELDGMYIVGPPFSGYGARGIMFDEGKLTLTKGDRGIQGPQGLPGEKGDKGDKGDGVPTTPGSGDYALTVSDGVISWTQIEDCE